MSRARGYAKVDAVRRFLRRLPEDIRAPLRRVITNTAERILDDAWAAVPMRTGKLARSLSMKVSRDGLSAEVGQRGAKGKKAFYGRFVEFGTRSYAKGAVRSARASHTTKIIKKTVAGHRARPFFFPAVEKNTQSYKTEMQAALAQTMKRILNSGGASE